MTISTNEAAYRLSAAGMTVRQARRVLSNGLAGASRRTVSARRYDEAAVEELVDRPFLDEAELDAACPWGIFIARRDVPTGLPREQQIEVLRGGWGFSPITSAWLRSRIDRHGYVPFVATVGSFVVVGMDVTDVRGDEVGRSLVLAPAGPWYLAVRGRRIAAGPGRPWVIRGWQFPTRDVGGSSGHLRPRRQEPV